MIKKKNHFPFFIVHSSNLSLLHLNYIHVHQSISDSSASVTDGNKTINLNQISFVHSFALWDGYSTLLPKMCDSCLPPVQHILSVCAGNLLVWLLSRNQQARGRSWNGTTSLGPGILQQNLHLGPKKRGWLWGCLTSTSSGKEL